MEILKVNKQDYDNQKKRQGQHNELTVHMIDQRVINIIPF